MAASRDTDEALATLDNPGGTRGLVSAYITCLGSGTTLTDFSGNGNNLTIANASMWNLTTKGYELTTQNSGTWQCTSTSSAFKIGDTDSATFAILFKGPSSKTDLDGVMGQTVNSSWAAGWGVHFETITGTQYLVCWVDDRSNASKRVLLAASSVVAGEDNLIIVRIDRETSPGNTILKLTLKTSANEYSDQTSAISATTLNTGSMTQYVGSLNPGGSPLQSGSVKMFAFWRKALSAAEVTSLIDDPYRLACFPFGSVIEPLNPGNGKRWMGYRPVGYNAATDASLTYLHGTFVSSDTQQTVLQKCMGVIDDVNGRFGGPSLVDRCDFDGRVAAVLPMFYFNGGGGGMGASSYANITMGQNEISSLWVYLKNLTKPFCNTTAAKSKIAGWSSGLALAFSTFIKYDYWYGFIGCHGCVSYSKDDVGALVELNAYLNNPGQNDYTWDTQSGSWAYTQTAAAATAPSVSFTTTSVNPSFDWKTRTSRGFKKSVWINGSNDIQSGNTKYYELVRPAINLLRAYGYGTAKEVIYNGGNVSSTANPPTAPDGYHANHNYEQAAAVVLTSSNMQVSRLIPSTWVDPDAPPPAAESQNLTFNLDSSVQGMPVSSGSNDNFILISGNNISAGLVSI
jgi:hypothetical protein